MQTLAFAIISDAPMPEVTDRDRIAMIAELANASGIAGMCGGQALIWRQKASGSLWTRWNAFIAIRPALIRAAVRLGALSAGDKGRNTLPILDRYAEVSALPSRFRMTFWMWWAILQR